MEMGSFLELQFQKGKEYYSGDKDIARLNHGKAAIWHAFRLTGCKSVWLPIYQCDTVRDFFKRKEVEVKYYHIDSMFTPIDCNPADDEAIVIVNYFGIMSTKRLEVLSANYSHVIIDNSQAFFSIPVLNAYNAYSARKFVGVSDGAYVIGKEAGRFTNEYLTSNSSDTASFLLLRIEYGCEGKAYVERSKNEYRLENEDIMLMSKLTRVILDGTEYSSIIDKRRSNFEIADKLLGPINKMNAKMHYDDKCVPMVYPLVVEDDTMIDFLLNHKHFQGRWWDYILDEIDEKFFEYWISRYIVPITIDQRYSNDDVANLCKLVIEHLG